MAMDSRGRAERRQKMERRSRTRDRGHGPREGEKASRSRRVEDRGVEGTVGG